MDHYVHIFYVELKVTDNRSYVKHTDLRWPVCLRVKGQFSGSGLNPCKPGLSLTHLISNYMTKELLLAEQRVETVSVFWQITLSASAEAVLCM